MGKSQSREEALVTYSIDRENRQLRDRILYLTDQVDSLILAARKTGELDNERQANRELRVRLSALNDNMERLMTDNEDLRKLIKQLKRLIRFGREAIDRVMTKGGWDDTGTQAVKNYMEEVDAITDIDPRIGDDYTEQEPQEPLNAEKYTVPAD